jgi:hypothetical protein
MIHCIKASRAIIKISRTSCRNKSNEKTLPTSNDVEIVADDNTKPRKLAHLAHQLAMNQQGLTWYMPQHFTNLKQV